MTHRGYRQTPDHVEKRIAPRRVAVTIERLMAQSFRIETGCLLWIGLRDVGGYGILKSAGKRTPVHVAAWRLFFGVIPPGLKVLHRCDVRNCWEPSHLWTGTQKDNVADMWAKGRAGDHRSRPRPWMRGRKRGKKT